MRSYQLEFVIFKLSEASIHVFMVHRILLLFSFVSFSQSLVRLCLFLTQRKPADNSLTKVAAI